VHGRHKIATALKWEQSADVLSVIGELEPAHVTAARDLGATLAAMALERRT
jgi:hypothetical protein